MQSKRQSRILDDIDYEILSILQQDYILTAVELSRKLGQRDVKLGPAACSGERLMVGAGGASTSLTITSGGV